MTQIGWCPSSRLDELQGFIDEHWKAGHVLARDADLLRWQHPHPDPERISVLVADGERGDMEGILGIIPVGFCARGDLCEGAWLTTWVVRPEQRPKQLGLKLLQHAMAETDGMVATLGGNETTMRILRALRFDIRQSVPRWVRPVSLEAFEGLVRAAGVDAPAGTWAAWREAASRGLPALGDPGLVAWSDESAARWDEAWRLRFAAGLVGTWRDAAYLRWRYLEHPSFDYEVRFAESGGELTGLLVFRRQHVRDRDESVLRVVELLGDADAGAALTAHLLREASVPDVAFLDFYCTSPGFARPLEQAGFLAEDSLAATLPSLFSPLDARRTSLTGAFWAPPDLAGGPSALFSGDDVYFTRSDCDQDRPN